MNIFVLDTDPRKAVRQYPDAHVRKMGIEAAQMLCTAIWKRSGHRFIYKPVYVNHPCTVWVGETWENFMWTLDLAWAIMREYEYRFDSVHATTRVLKAIERNLDRLRLLFEKDRGLTPFPKVVHDEAKSLPVVLAYREYYRKYKTRLFKWTRRPVPYWLADIVPEEGIK